MSALFAPRTFPDVHFHILREQDIAAVSCVESDVYAFPWSEGNFRDSLLAGYRCWGCWSGNELIGYAILMISIDEAHLLNLAVTKHWQRRGVGRHMLQFIMDEARKSHCVMLYLEVRPSNHAALRLYAATGFRQFGMRRDYYPAQDGRENALFLGLELV
jgi:ribosomal-protein-alanine N-acetyltransferase